MQPVSPAPVPRSQANPAGFQLPPSPSYHNFYITLTHRCNLRCVYCGEEGLHCGVDPDLNCDLEQLARFLSKYRPYYLTLYGGEPCLRPKLIAALLDRLDPTEVVLHTNGTMLRNLQPFALLEKIRTIILSIDGGPALTDYYRGEGTYQLIADNIKWLLDSGWDHRVFARMTVSEQTQHLDRAVIHLLNVPWCRFDGVCWQLNALFKSPGYDWSDFPDWLSTRYEPAIDRLTDHWHHHLRNGVLLPIIPLNEILVSCLSGIPTDLRCGAGWRDFAVTTQGQLLPCPIAGMEAMQLCEIWDENVEIHNRCGLSSPCTTCSYLPLCGGRCLFANRFNEWGEGGFRLVCRSIQHLIRNVQDRVETIREFVLRDSSLWERLSQRIHHGCEVIP